MITVVGSRDLLLTEEMAVKLTSIISTTDRVGVRATQEDELASPIERLASLICESLGVPVVRYSAVSSRSGVFHRDYALVRSSSAVFAVFAPNRVMDGGTGHVIKAALDEEIPVEAYTVDDDGSLLMIGSDDGNPYRVHSASRPDVLSGMWGAE